MHQLHKTSKEAEKAASEAKKAASEAQKEANLATDKAITPKRKRKAKKTKAPEEPAEKKGRLLFETLYVVSTHYF